MNAIVLELYELSDAMAFMEGCTEGQMQYEPRYSTGNSYILGLLGRRVAELAALLEQESNEHAAAGQGAKHRP